MTSVRNLLRDQSGATVIEYGLIMGLVALVIVGGATAVGTKISAALSPLATLN